MTIEIDTIRERDEYRQYVILYLVYEDGTKHKWSHGAVPVGLSEAEVQTWLEEREDAMREDMARNAALEIS